MIKYVGKFCCCLLSLTNLVLAYSAPAVGDRAEVRIWYSTSNIGNGNGLGGILSLVNIETTFSDAHIFTFILDSKSGGKSLISVPPEGYRIAISLVNRKPAVVVSGTAKFINGPWISGISSNFGYSGTLDVCFPVLPPEDKYEEKDWFLVRFNDTIGVQCEYRSSQRAFYGTVKKYNNRQDVTGDPVITGEKYALYTKETPFRLGAIVIHSSISEYINKQFKGLGEGYYGITLGNYISTSTNDQRKTPDNIKNNRSQNLRNFDSRGRINK